MDEEILKKNYDCPYCGKKISIPPIYIPKRDDVQFCITRRGTKQYFHKSCLKKEVKNVN